MPKYGIEQARFDKKWPSRVDSMAGPVEDSSSGNEFLRGREDVGSNTKKKKKKKKERRREAFMTNLDVNLELR